MVLEAVLVGAGVLCCSVMIVFTCVCHLFKREGGFTSFENDVENGRVKSPNDSGYDMSTSNVSFEPLPDILAKTVGTRALRPRITCSDKDKQSAAAKLVTVYQPFPRNQLLYIKEIGLGWFGQVLQGSADNICPESRQTKVVVKILKDDATAAEKSLFLEEVAPYRDLEHTNILRLLGQCTETLPYLTILEFPPLGDLKTFLLAEQKGPFLQFGLDAARGLACMHKHSYIHHDVAARSCLLMSDFTLKIGDYGIGEDLYREDYYDTGCDLLPIRWMSPESLELKQGVWQITKFSAESNVWSLSVLLWEILTMGRKPYAMFRDEDILHNVIRDGKTKLSAPSSDIPLHDRWYEIMEMCWQEADDRPTADDIVAFLQQIGEEAANSPSMETMSPSAVPRSQTDSSSSSSFDSLFVQSKSKPQLNHHVAEVLVHRADDKAQQQGFEDDFSKTVHIRKNRAANGFEDDFVSSESSALNHSTDLNSSQNESILAGGSVTTISDNSSESDKFQHMLAADTNMNLVSDPVPVSMSTPSKKLKSVKNDQSESYNTALSSQIASQQSSKFVTASEGDTLSSRSDSEVTNGRSEAISERSENVKAVKTDNQNSDRGDRTNDNDVFETDDDVEKMDSKEGTDFRLKVSDYETEKAKEIYMSKGATLTPTFSNKSRSLGTIPEDGIPSDNTSQSGVVFDDPEADDVGMNFEWDDYVGEQLVGRVRYSSSDESSQSARSPRHVEVEEWPFDQDSSSEGGHSKHGSLASESDGEVTHTSIDSSSSIDTRARIASILTNRLNSLIKQTNSSPSGQGSMFYSISQYDNEPDSPEHAFTAPHRPSGRALAPIDSESVSSMSSEDGHADGGGGLTDMAEHDEQDDQLIKQDLDKIAASVLTRTDPADVVISQPSDQMLPSASLDTIA